MKAMADRTAADFLAFAVQAGVLRCVELKTKAGHLGPCVFNAGPSDDASSSENACTLALVEPLSPGSTSTRYTRSSVSMLLTSVVMRVNRFESTTSTLAPESSRP